MKIFLTVIFIILQSGLFVVADEYVAPDPTPLTILIYEEQNVTIYASTSNPQRDPKQWIFWYDPILKFEQLREIHQFNEYIRFQFSFGSSDFDQIARTSVVRLMHPDVERFAMFWTIEPLSIDVLNVYIINQKGIPVASVYPCTKTYVSGMNTHECQFQTSSMIAAVWMKDNLVCGKYKIQFEYYFRTNSQQTNFPPSLITQFNLNNLRANFDPNKYIHPRQETDLISRYFVQLQMIDNTIQEARVQKIFRSILNIISRYEVTKLSDLWFGEQLETIINRDLFYITLRGRHQFLFHLKSSKSPWALTSTTKQTFNVTEIQTMFFDQLKIQAEWSSNERFWQIKSITTHFLSDVLDFLQLVLINQQQSIDKVNATVHRIIDCSAWSHSCVCQSSVPAIVFTSTTQVIRIAHFETDLSSSGFTFELRVRPDVLPKEADEVHILNFRGEYHLTYQPRGEITFSVIEQGQSYLFTTSLQSIPLNKWTHIAGVYSVFENQLQLYINGEFVSSIIHSKKTYPMTKDILLGQNFRGALRDFRVWACPLSGEIIYKNMGLDSLMGNETCLLGYWPMIDGIGPIIPDIVTTSPPRPGTLGFDDNPSFVTDPIWAHVLPIPPSPPEPPTIDYRMFRINISSPFVVTWGSPFDQPTPGDFDGDGLADFGVYRTIASTWLIAPSSSPNIMLSKVWGLTTDRPYPANFDGDKFADFVLFRPATGEWIGQLSSNPTYIFTHRWGRPGDNGCPGDFDGDGKADFAVFRAGVFYINPSTDPSIQWTKQWGQIDDRVVPNCDFDGDGRTDFTVWTPTTAIWSWIPSSAPWLIYQKQWGFTLDRPFCGDYDGDKLKDFVAYRNWTGEWFVLPTRLATFLITFQWGYPTDIPVGGDYDGDGRADFGLWRPRRNRSYVWEIIPSIMPTAMLRKGWGIEGDQPVIGDFDRDKRSDFTVWRPSTGFWYILLISTPGIQQIKHWGFSFNDTALAADWDGDLFTDYTIYRPTTGFWHIMLARNPLLQIIMQWGIPQLEDVGVPGDFDGDGKFDFAVWRPSTGVWFILPSSNPSTVIMSQWGIKGDIPVTGADFDGDGKTDIAVWRPASGSWFILPSSNPVYPFFGPNVIRQPKVDFPPPPPPPGAPIPPPPPPPPPIEKPKTTTTETTTESPDYQ